MQKIIVSDTSCLILFHKIGELELLQKVFGHLIITETVSKELGITISESLGILVTAKNRGVIDSVMPIIEKIMQTNFRLSNKLIKKVLQHVNEG